MAENTERACAITTIDNPYNPFTQFDEWFTFDQDKGYCTCSYLDRIAHTSDQLTDEENERIREKAIDDIIKLDFRMIYRKIWSDDPTPAPHPNVA